jgi:hypothetical protein
VLTTRRRPTEDIEDWSLLPTEWARILCLATKNNHVNVDAHQMVEMFFQDPFKIKAGGMVYQGQLNV